MRSAGFWLQMPWYPRHRCTCAGKDKAKLGSAVRRLAHSCEHAVAVYPQVITCTIECSSNCSSKQLIESVTCFMTGIRYSLHRGYHSASETIERAACIHKTIKYRPLKRKRTKSTSDHMSGELLLDSVSNRSSSMSSILICAESLRCNQPS